MAHHPVMLPEVMSCLDPKPGGVYLDATLGGAGHAEAILEASGPDGVLLGMDRDLEAIARATARLARFRERVVLRHGQATSMAALVDDAGKGQPDGILMDLGVSSFQLDAAERGFSFQRAGPLDMRMDSTAPLTADQVVNESNGQELAALIRRFGEEPQARRIAHAIVDARPIRDTLHLAEVVASAVRGGYQRLHPATRTFQALRIVVNGELDEVQGALQAALQVVAPGGRVVVIAFHSLEDRLVKSAFRSACGQDAPRDAYGHPVTAPGFERVTRKALKGEDLDSHPRARSARLRAVQRIGAPVRGDGENKECADPRSPPRMMDKVGELKRYVEAGC